MSRLTSAKINGTDAVQAATSQAELRRLLHLPRNAERILLGELLSLEARLSQTGIFKALAQQKGGNTERIGQLLLKSGRVNERDVYAALSHQLGLPFVRLSEFDVDPQARMLLSQHVVRSLSALPLMLDRDRLIVAVSEPGDAQIASTLRFAAGCPIEIVLATPDDIRAAIATHYPPFEDASFTEQSVTSARSAETERPALEQVASQAPIVRLVSSLIQDAVNRHASDIHIRPGEESAEALLRIEVQPAIDYGFATALRHILRHDPDVILIGEIRDRETARIAVESALTGHLVLSTIHTNSAVQTIARLIEIGIEPYLVNSTLAGVLAQRLVRRNCKACRRPETVEPIVRTTLGVTENEPFWRGAGCDECAGTGYHGRMAVYELLEMSAALRERIHAGAGEDELQAIAERKGMVRLTAQALALARTGETSLLEVYRARLE